MNPSTAIVITLIYVSTVFSCENGWIPFGQSCYRFSQTKLSWQNARSNCKSLNADIVVVSSKEENDFLISSNPSHQDLWLGINDVDSEANFHWVDTGECSPYTNWGAAEPNNYGSGEDCVELDITHSDKWNDVPCTMLFAYVCEKNNFVDTQPPSFGSSCPDDIHVLTNGNDTSASVAWNPPVWTDDSFCFTETNTAFTPGEVFKIPKGSLGRSDIMLYTATDGTGKSSMCSFKVTVTLGNSYQMCLNGGSIVEVTGGLSCACAPGFSGLLCDSEDSSKVSEKNVNYKMCKNGGNLTELADGTFSCTCTSGFSGILCEMNYIEGTRSKSTNQLTVDSGENSKENSSDRMYLLIAVIFLTAIIIIMLIVINKLSRRSCGGKHFVHMTMTSGEGSVNGIQTEQLL